MGVKIVFRLSLFLFFIVLNGCSQKKLSERDLRIQENQQKNDLKKSEYQAVTGTYLGQLTRPNQDPQKVRLLLEVKEVPESENQPEPVLVPKLTGSLRFLYGADDSSDYVEAAIKSAEFNRNNSQLSLVVYHQQFNDLLISATLTDRELHGTWSANTVGLNGEIHLIQSNAAK